MRAVAKLIRWDEWPDELQRWQEKHAHHISRDNLFEPGEPMRPVTYREREV